MGWFDKNDVGVRWLPSCLVGVFRIADYDRCNASVAFRWLSYIIPYLSLDASLPGCRILASLGLAHEMNDIGNKRPISPRRSLHSLTPPQSTSHATLDMGNHDHQYGLSPEVLVLLVLGNSARAEWPDRYPTRNVVALELRAAITRATHTHTHPLLLAGERDAPRTLVPASPTYYSPPQTRDCPRMTPLDVEALAMALALTLAI